MLEWTMSIWSKNCNRFNSGYKIIKQLKPSVGANNLLNVYPDKQDNLKY
jgi:hypothetical protein